MKKLIIAEKPSVAADLAKTLGKFKKSGNLFENNEMVIASAIGHIVELYMPEDFDKKLKWWTLQTLPIIPDKFKVKPIEKTKDRLAELKKLMQRDDIEEIINACDAGREGELIFTYVYEYVGCKKPVKRLWMSSMTPEGIKEAFKHLRANKEMIPLQQAAKCRSESDWLIGINGTRAITCRMFGRRSRQLATVGRVQTPTLTMVYEREKEIKNFKPRGYWRILGEFGIQSGSYEGIYQKQDFKKEDDEHDRIDRIWDKKTAETVFKDLEKEKTAIIEEKKKSSKQTAPLLYDLTTLQREANARFGMPAGITLKIAQSLYEKHKLLTYPRTDSKALPEDYGPTCISALEKFNGNLGDYAKKVIKNKWVDTQNKRIFNNNKVSDHFAIIPTTEEQTQKLSDDEKKIYDMVARRFIAAFYPPAEFDITTRISIVGKHEFKTEGKVLVHSGWLEVHGRAIMNSETLPALIDKDGTPPKASVNNIRLEQEETKPPARYSEATLLGAMEHACKLVEDEDHAEAMKGKGIGTPATRAQIIEHLIRERYILRENRELIPTVKAENLIQFLHAIKAEEITSPAMTGDWEFKLHQIEAGELTRKEFMDGILEITRKMVNRTKEFDESKLEKHETSIIAPTDHKPMMETFRAFRSQDDKIVVYKTMGNRRLNQEEVKELMANGVIGPLDDFRSKAGKPFSAMLRLDEEYKVKFDFGTTSSEGEKIDFSQFQVITSCPKASKGLCSCATGNIYITPTAYQCENHKAEGKPKCDFRVSRTLLGRAIPEDQFLKLVNEKKTDLLDKFKSRRTNRFFSAHLILKEDCSIGFEFEAKAPKKPKASKGKKIASKTAQKQTDA